MIFLIISILASVSVSVLLKVAKRNQIDIAQAVAFNYPVAILLSFIFLKPDLSTFSFSGHWYLFGLLGILLPSVFIIMGIATQTAGIVKADTAQRLSLVFTLVIAFFFWNETATTRKIIGIIIAFIALILLLNKPQKNNANKTKNSLWILPLVWLGYGVIDLVFKLISKSGDYAFGTNLTVSFIIATVLIFAYLFHKKTKFNVRSLIGGIVLGALNFTNIFTYIKAHQVMSENPSMVFTGMNIGVIALGTLLGLFLFQEKLNKLNYIGIALAILAVFVLFI
ncbi:EamA family transporter [Flavobacteriaceae bacterium Ap0902]|nr:EamA family transporter [Flavobacteriaceae bacterium Ap0902]